MAKRKKDGNSNNLGRILFIIVCLILSYTGFIFVWRYMHHSEIEAVHLQQYNAVLLRAKELLMRYKNATAGKIHTADVDSIDTPQSFTMDQKPKTIIDSPLSQTVITSSSVLRKEVNLPPPQSTPAQKDLVIGMAMDTDSKNFAVFCGSLRSVSPADIVIFVNIPTPKNHKDIANKYNVKLIDFDVKTLPSSLVKYHPSSLRWPLIYNYLKDDSVRNLYNRVLMIDVRDSMFQSDPFAILPLGASAFYAFGGVEDKTISECGWNGGWIKDCFGDNVLQQVGSNPIICSGVSMASIDTAMKYLQLMNDIILGKNTFGKFPTCERNGVDQGVHNVLVHKRMIPNLKVIKTREGLVSNMQARLVSVQGVSVYSLKGGKVPIAHQYDRYPELQKLLFEKYVYWTKPGDVLGEWAQESSCTGYTFSADKDLFKGKCDLKAQGASSPASCCGLCLKTADCRGFTFYGGLCFFKNCKTPVTNNDLPGAFSAYLSQ